MGVQSIRVHAKLLQAVTAGQAAAGAIEAAVLGVSAGDRPWTDIGIDLADGERVTIGRDRTPSRGGGPRITSLVPPEKAARLFRLAGLRPMKNEDLFTGFDQYASNQEERSP